AVAIQGAVVAALVYGMHVASSPVVEKTINVEIQQTQARPVAVKPLPAPRMALPPMLTAPPPLIDITTAPAPSAPVAIPPQPAAPVTTRAAPVASAAPAARGETQDSYYGRLLAHL